MDNDVSRSLQSAAAELKARRPHQAVEICRRTVAKFPHDAQAHYALAFALAETSQLDQAIDAYQEATRLKPDFFQAFTNLGIVLAKRGRFDEAVEASSRAAALRPEMAEMHVNLSNVLRDHWKLDHAVLAARKALDLKPDLPEAHLALGAALQAMGRFDEAIAACRHAIQLKPNMASAHLNLGLAELVLGNLQVGWPEYEWRRRCADAVPPRQFSKPMWDGSRIDGKTILLFSEQGFGDAIHFIRYAPLVAGMGGKVILECPRPLLRLLRHFPGIERIVPEGQAPPDFDFYCALPSLPGLFNTALDSIPASRAYLSADAAATAAWRERIKPQQDIFAIGLAWMGRADNRNDHNRSIPLEQFSPLAAAKGARLHSVLPIPARNTAMEISDWSNSLNDFADTAALVANLDLIVTVDTAAAHLAAALGKQVWLLLPFPPDWRWLLNRSDSPWYPTIRLFRQETAGDWDMVIRRVADEIEDKLATDKQSDADG